MLGPWGVVGGTGYRPTAHLFGHNRREDEPIGLLLAGHGPVYQRACGPLRHGRGLPAEWANYAVGAGSWAAERAANGGLVETVLAQELRAAAVLGRAWRAAGGASTRGWPRSPIGSSRSPSHTGTAPPSRTRALEVEALGRVDEVAQRLVAQARRVEAAELHGLGIGGEREQQVAGATRAWPRRCGLLRRGLERALGGVGERQRRLAPASPAPSRARTSSALQRHQHRERAQHAEQQVAGADLAAAQRRASSWAQTIACRASSV